MVLALFLLTHYVFCAICMTLPVPSGCFMPIFVLGAAIGRLFGEIVAVTIPALVGTGLIVAVTVPALVGNGLVVNPGVYSVVGKGVNQPAQILPKWTKISALKKTNLPDPVPSGSGMAVLISNAVCAYLTPSFFDTIIKIKHLPFLPDIPPSSNIVHIIQAENIMVSPVQFVTKIISYADIQQTLIDGPDFKIFPVVGEEARREEAGRRVRKAIETIDMHFRTSFKEIFDHTSTITSPTNTRTKSESSLPPKFTLTREAPAALQREDEKRNLARRHLQKLVRVKYLQNDQEEFVSDLAQLLLKHQTLKLLNIEDIMQRHWEAARLNEEVDLTDDIDPAPFQIVKKTSLFNVSHTSFPCVFICG
ncbi:unnamed protein product [Strongylus vulgaris]|uniref:Uncharacterized protein n=1 Tax=Strongylus vulgaris TaxID=40348 RepID=A0A3P7IUJ1_STRVU|nr:unnamed protein product [Strongylus vulgaris]